MRSGLDIQEVLVLLIIIHNGLSAPTAVHCVLCHGLIQGSSPVLTPNLPSTVFDSMCKGITGRGCTLRVAGGRLPTYGLGNYRYGGVLAAARSSGKDLSLQCGVDAHFFPLNSFPLLSR